MEVAPGLFAEVFFGAEAHRQAKGEEARMRGRRPGRPFDAIGRQGGGRFGLGVTVLFFPADQFAGAQVRYRETLTLPARPQIWPEPDEELPEAVRQKIFISTDGRSFTTEQTVHMTPGQMIPSYKQDEAIVILYPFPTHAWGVADSDPLGQWKIEAYINERLVLREQFEVVEGDAVSFRATPTTSPTPIPRND